MQPIWRYRYLTLRGKRQPSPDRTNYYDGKIVHLLETVSVHDRSTVQVWEPYIDLSRRLGLGMCIQNTI